MTKFLFARAMRWNNSLICIGYPKIWRGYEKTLNKLRRQNPEKIMNRAGVDKLLNELFSNSKKKHKTNRRIIIEASAIVAYQQLPHAIRLLLTDDAPQFKKITELLALCWVHDGRHYKKLEPVIQLHKKQLEDFLTAYWKYYRKLLDYKQSPTSLLSQTLSDEFDTLFSVKTGYAQLDDRIEKTMAKKDSLLLSLKYPEIPLHNNASELGARTQARYRDISLQTQNLKGTESKDTLMTIVETAKKLGGNAFDYIRDRISKKFEMPSLANMIKVCRDSAIYNPS